MKQIIFTLIALVLLNIVLLPDAKAELLFDFESGTFDGWTVEGTAFGEKPQTDETLKKCKHRGIYLNSVRRSFGGKYVASTLQTAFTKHEISSLTSPEFTISKRYLNLKMGGESRNFLQWKSSEGAGIQVLIDGKVVLEAPYKHRVPFLRWYSFDLKKYLGKKAQLRIYDTKHEAFLLVDDIMLEDTPRGLSENERKKTLKVTGPIINIPSMANNSQIVPYPTMRVLHVIADGKIVQDITTFIAAGKPDFYVPLYVDDWMGKEITLEVDQLDAGSTTMKDLKCAKELTHDGDLYKEELRPRVHFSPSTGFCNDPNGLVYFDGEYHLFWQHDPFNMGNLNFYWGHAVSTDLVHWQELRPALRGKLESVGFAWSGGGFIDWNNDAGWQKGKDPTLVVAFWDYHIRKSSLAYSNDRGRHFTRFEGNPIVDSKGSDPSRVWFHKPTKEWCLAVTDRDENNKAGLRLFHSKDLKKWTKGNLVQFRNRAFYECPDFYELPVCDRNGKPLTPKQTRWILHDGSHYYAVCNFDGKTITIEEEPGLLVDPGHFYAAQSYSDIPARDGRKIVMAWQRRLEVPQPSSIRKPIIPKKVQPFNGQLTFPVEMTLRQTEDGLRLFAKPVREIANLHAEKYSYENVKLGPGKNFTSPTRPESMHAVIDLKVGKTGKVTFILNGLHVVYDCAKQELQFLGKTRKLKPNNGIIRLETILDITSVVIFANDGEIYAPINHIARIDQRGLEIKVEGGNAEIVKAELYYLNSMWKNKK